MMRHDIALRALGTTLAALSISFAVYMLVYGGGKMRVNGLEHLAIFAQPRGDTSVKAPDRPGRPSPPIDPTPTGALAPSEPAPVLAPVEIVAARADRVWLRIDGAIVAAAPGDDVPRVGRIAAILPRDGGWALVDAKGATLMAVAGRANAAPLFGRKMIFE